MFLAWGQRWKVLGNQKEASLWLRSDSVREKWKINSKFPGRIMNSGQEWDGGEICSNKLSSRII